MTRAWVFLMHGDVPAAVSANPFSLIALPAAVVFVVSVGLALVRRRRAPDVSQALRSGSAQMVVAGWITFGVARAILVAIGAVSI